MFLTTWVSGLIAQNGVVKGKILEGDDASMPVGFASIWVIEAAKGTTADLDGLYHISLPAGKYNFVVRSMGYLADTVSVLVKADASVERNFSLNTAETMIDEVEVVGRVVRESEAMQLVERKNATGVESNIGSKELSKTGSSDVAAGLTKVSGVSLVGSKHIFVRGMGDRYNSAYLNGLPIASLDPDKKVISLDIFPTNVVSSLSVAKAFTPDLYGDFSGGAIDIRTINYPDSATINVKIGTGVNTQSTFRDFKTYDGGSLDFLGYDDGSRQIPSEIGQLGNLDNYNSSVDGTSANFKNNFSPQIIKALPNTSINLLAGNKFNLKRFGDEMKLGVVVMGMHSTGSTYKNGYLRNFNKQGTALWNYKFENFGFNTNSSALANLHLDINENHSIGYNFLFVNTSSDEVMEMKGHNNQMDIDIFARRMTFKQNKLATHQVKGKHNLLDERLPITWVVSSNKGTSQEPDRRQLIWLHSKDVYQLNDDDITENHRFYSMVRESEIAGRVDLKYVINRSKDEFGDYTPTWTVLTGGQCRIKDRYFDYQQFNYDIHGVNNANLNGVDPNSPDQYINEQTLSQGNFFIKEGADAASENNADLDVMAAYVATDVNIGKKLNIYAGVRAENGMQRILYRDQNQPYRLVAGGVDTLNFLPSLVAKYTFSDKHIARLSASKTISRPGFKEMALFEYTEYFAGLISFGNPDLVNGANYNADLRYEIYPRSGELIAITGFGKLLKNPIERVMLASASGQRQSFDNAEEGVVAGVELEVRKKLDTLFQGTPVLRDLTVGTNLSYIYSQVKLAGVKDGNASTVQTNSSRALQGASPYLINFDLSYEKRLSDQLKATVGLAYNIYGKRIQSSGIYGLGDIYEMPVNMLNLVVKAEVNDRWTVGFSGRNLINQEIRVVQDTEAGERELNSYRRGINFGFSVGYKFL